MASILVLVPVMVRCASDTIDEAVPLANQRPLSGGAAAAPNNTGQYPNINVVPTGEVSQLSDSQTASTRLELEGEALAQQQGGESAENYLERLRKLQLLGSTHAANVLRQIENAK